MVSVARSPGDQQLPKHVAIIMDGNGRWAEMRGIPRVEGHRRGANVVNDVVKAAHELGVECLSLYAFSSENWSRPKSEVRALMALLSWLLPKQLEQMMAQGVRLSTLGDLSQLPLRTQKVLHQAINKTQNNQGLHLVLCLNYGGQQEILAAAKELALQTLISNDPQSFLAQTHLETFRAMMWRNELPVVDLLIRTGGEYRISNFHLWDAAYAELYFDAVLWPDYQAEHLIAALKEYSNRERRFGLISAQVAPHE
ncbi:MAG: di-trans,poly-cis-decaprenylcistransferase [Zetaproteobacteria bacterium]|nr:di-trans,poly-cis-decaprenylcistransferase [Zetaproteobacteria bacterium]